MAGRSDMRRAWASLGTVLLLVGCAGGGSATHDRSTPSAAAPATSSASGRYTMDRDAYPDLPPDVSNVPDAVPRVEPLSPGGNRPTYEVWGKTYQVLSDVTGYESKGIASWYGEKFHGYSTANGEIYDMYKMTAAHRSLPLPSFARVTSVDNGRSVIVRVNDRGPFHEDRVIDLSYAAAARLDILGNGTGRVHVEAIDPVAWQNERRQRSGNGGTQLASSTSAINSSPPGQGAGGRAVPASANGAGSGQYLQVAALGSASNAEALKARLQAELNQPVRISSDTRVHRVQVGPVSDSSHLEPLRDELRRAGFTQTLVINDNP